MVFENRFRHPASAIPETFSGRRVPCHLERPSLRQEEFDKANDGTTAVNDECPYRGFCRATAAGLESLFVCYGKSVAVTLTEQSSSISVRSEHRFGGEDRFRLTLRKHLFETLPGGRVPQQRFRLTSESLANLQTFWKSGWPPLPAPGELERSIGLEDDDKFLSRDQLKDAVDNWLGEHGLKSEELDELRLLIRWFASGSLYCHAIERGDSQKFGEYIGFVDLRENNAPSSLAIAVLKPPRHLRFRSDVILLTGEYSRLFGGEAFEGSVFSMQEGSKGGVICADACLVMALGMLSDRVPTLEGGFDLAYLAAVCNRDRLFEQPKSCESSCLGANDNLDGSFRIGGLTGVQMANLGDRLSKELAFSRGDQTPPDDRAIGASLLHRKGVAEYSSAVSIEQHDRMLLRIIEANLLAKFPMILNVDSDRWTEVRTGTPPKPPRDIGHAVVIVGLSGNLDNHKSANLIVHDPGVGPFVEIPFDAAVSAARALKLKQTKQAGNIVSMVTFFPRSSVPAEFALCILQYRARGPIVESYLEQLMEHGRIDLVDPRDSAACFSRRLLVGLS